MFSKRSAAFLSILLVTLPVSASEISEAVIDGDVAKVRELIAADPAIVMVDDEQGRSLLHLAIGKNLPELWALVSVKEKINEINSIGLPVSFLAILNSEPAALEFVLEQGADVDFHKRIDEVTPLHWAAEQGSADHIRLLLRHGADPAATNASGSTPLLIATKAKNEQRMAALLEAKADPNQANMVGLTPLIFAAQRGFIEGVQALLAAGADPQHRDRRGQTAEDYASQRGREEVVTILRGAAAKEE